MPLVLVTFAKRRKVAAGIADMPQLPECQRHYVTGCRLIWAMYAARLMTTTQAVGDF